MFHHVSISKIYFMLKITFFLTIRESPEVVLSLPVTAERPFVGLTGQRDLDVSESRCAVGLVTC